MVSLVNFASIACSEAFASAESESQKTAEIATIQGLKENYKQNYETFNCKSLPSNLPEADCSIFTLLSSSSAVTFCYH